MKLLLCSVMLMLAIACSQSPTAPTSAEPPTQSGPGVMDLQWDRTAASCGTVAAPPAQPSTSQANIVRQTDTEIVASWPLQTNGRPSTLYARFVRENSGWALCSWDVADV